MKEKDYYQILEISPEATLKEIEEAYRRLKATYAPSSAGVSALFTPEELKEINQELDEAYRALSRKRGGGKVSLWQGASPSPPKLPPERLQKTKEDLGGLGGKGLKRVREEMGVSLREVAAGTKLTLQMLRYIEEEDYSHLPHWVYLKGFLTAYAKFLGLDPQEVIEDYRKGMRGP